VFLGSQACFYENLSKSTRQSNGFIENIDYKVFAGSNFMALKDMLQSGSTDLQINNKTRSITLLAVKIDP
jgi:hypothetical protein